MVSRLNFLRMAAAYQRTRFNRYSRSYYELYIIPYFYNRNLNHPINSKLCIVCMDNQKW